MSKLPVLMTERLKLRLPELGDAKAIAELLADGTVASTTLNIPYPYAAQDAADWIRSTWEKAGTGEGHNFAVAGRDDGALVGAVGLVLTERHARAELGYWIARRSWGNGLATEAAGRALEYAFGTLDVNRVCAHHFSRNPASGRVMVKIGLRHEGTFRQHVRRWDRFEDVELYGLLKSDWEEARQ